MRPSQTRAGGSALEGRAEKFVLSPDQSTLAGRSEAVKGQLEIKRHDLQVLAANAGTQICDVANCARLHPGFLAEKQHRAFDDFRSSDRSTLERAFPSIKIIKLVRHGAPPERRKNKAASWSVTPAAFAMIGNNLRCGYAIAFAPRCNETRWLT
jgi:hypothetical protein